MLNITEIRCKQALNKVDNSDLPQQWDLNLYRGCQHGCKYCWAVYTHDYLEGDFFNDLYVKVNIVEQLEKQLSSPNWKRETIGIAGVSDCYQPIEAKYKLMPEILKLMIKYKNPVSISTKSDLILRDYDLLDELSRITNVSISASIVCMDDNLRRKLEPAGRNAKKKFNMLKEFSKTNATTGVLQMPIIPYMTDSRENIEDLYAHAREANVDYIVPGMMYLRGNTRTNFFDFIKQDFPELFIPLTKIYQKGSKDKTEYKRALYRMVNELKRRYRLSSYYNPKPFPEADALTEIKKVATGFQQLSLFEETTPGTYTSASIPSKEQLAATQPEPPKKVVTPVNLNPFVEVEMGNTQQAEQIVSIPPTPTMMDEERAKFYAMRQIARDINAYGDHGKIFYEQARFMKDFEDDYAEVASFSSYFPYYQQMGYEQLRTYFTWRTKVRKGIVLQTSTAYAFLYIYELLNQVGVADPEDGLNKLITFWQNFRIFDDTIDAYVIKWLKDYHVYYPLPHSFEEFAVKYELISHYPTIFSYASDKENSLALFSSISKYDIKKSVFYTDEHQVMIHDCFYFILTYLREVFRKNGQCFEDLIFYPLEREMIWTPFNQALFYPASQQPQREVILSEREIYHCESDRFRYTSTMLTENGKQLVGYLIKEMESALREVVKFKYKLKTNPDVCDKLTLDKLREMGIVFPDFIHAAVKEFYRQLTHQEVKVDVSNLGRIRQEAYETQEKLIVPEDEMVKIIEVKPAVEIPKVESSTSSLGPWDELKTALTTVELEALALLIQGQSLKDFARVQLIMLEVLVDGINEKAMDLIGDTLLEIDDDVIVYDEYIENVSEMVEFSS